MIGQAAASIVSKLKTTSQKVNARKVGQVINPGGKLLMNNKTIKIALDSGNGAGKVWVGQLNNEGNSTENYLVVPSYIEVVDELFPFTTSSDGGVTFGYRYNESPNGEEVGFTRLVGQRPARSNGGGKTTIHAGGRKTQEAISFIVGAILSLDTDATEFDIDVAASVISREMGDYIRSSLNGVHKITVARSIDEVELTLRVNVVKVVPEGAALPAVSPELTRSTVVDIGNGTVILSSYDGSAIPVDRIPYNLGTCNLLDLAIRHPEINMAASANGDAAIRRYLLEESLISGSVKAGYYYAGIDITESMLISMERYAVSTLKPVWDETVRISNQLGTSPVLIGGGSQIPQVATALKTLGIGGKLHKMKRGNINVPARFFNVAAMYIYAGF